MHRRIKGKSIGQLKVVRVDTGGATILAREANSELEDYFIDAKLSDTDSGLQLMIRIGKRDHTGKKVQLFVEPGTKRMNFDRNEKDQHPAGIFTEVTATFKDTSVAIKSDDAEK